MSKPIIFNYGGGVQTIAVCILIVQNRLPVPERILMADTSREAKTTFEYLEKYARPLMRQVGCEIEIISHDLSKYDLYAKDENGNDADLPLMPVWTTQNGKVGQLLNFCSGTWKRDVVLSYLLNPENGYGQKNPIIQWFGYSVNEISRCKPSRVKWREHHFPLVYRYGIQMNRQDCIKLITDFGLPVPSKSRCWMCPFQSNAEWRELSPDEWQKAVDLDYEIRSKDQSNAVYLHRSGRPLVEADLTDKPEPLFDYSEIECAQSCWTFAHVQQL